MIQFIGKYLQQRGSKTKRMYSINGDTLHDAKVKAERHAATLYGQKASP